MGADGQRFVLAIGLYVGRHSVSLWPLDFTSGLWLAVGTGLYLGAGVGFLAARGRRRLHRLGAFAGGRGVCGWVFMFNGVRVGLDFDFGLGESCFTFVGYDHFHEGFFRMRGHEWGYHIGRERLHAFYGRSVIRNEFRRDEHGRFVNNGIGRDRIERLTHVQHSNFEERRPVGDRNQLARQRAEHLERATPVMLARAISDMLAR